jgi:small subunit ribosomal protein S20
MANSAQARKRARQAVKQRAHNASQRSALRTAVKRVRQAIATGDKAAAQSVFSQSMSIIDRIADKKIIHKNKADRYKSRLAAQIKTLSSSNPEDILCPRRRPLAQIEARSSVA